MAVHTVASHIYGNRTVNDLIDNTFDDVSGFWRSIKTFLIAFAGYDSLSPIFYQQKFDEYVNAMKDLYSVPNVDLSHLDNIVRQLPFIEMHLLTAIKRVKGLNNCRGLKVLQTVAGVTSPEFPVTMTTEIQTINFALASSFRNYRRYRTKNKALMIQVVADHWAQPHLPLNQFSILFRDISAEGYQDWFDFGRGVQMLIEIRWAVGTEPFVDATKTGSFHLHTIYFQLIHRIHAFNALSSTMERMHRSPSNKFKVTYIRKRIDPNSAEAFWSTPRLLANIMERIRTEVLDSGATSYRGLLSQSVKYADHQITPVIQSEQYEDTVCLCGEWCNWNAFFHFNPIYRTVLVLHNQYTLTNRTNVPDIYLAVTAIMMYRAEVQRVVGDPPPKAPVLYLLHHANEWRMKNYNALYLTNLFDFRTHYVMAYPPFSVTLVLAYKIIRELVILPELVLQTSFEPFDDVCTDCLTNTYKVLSDLHLYIGGLASIVPVNRKYYWFKELDQISRENVGFYLRLSYENRIADKNPKYDYLFSEDYECSAIIAATDEEIEIKRIRERVFRFATPMNPWNIRVTLEPIVVSFLGVYKFIRKVDSLLPVPHSSKSTRDSFECFRWISLAFENYITTDDFLFYTDFEDPTKGPINMADCQHLYFFYTLKLYFMAFCIQSHCINTLIRYSEHSTSYWRQSSNEFHFLWNSLYIVLEKKYETVYNSNIFYIPLDIGLNIDDFYGTFWGWADHEQNPGQNLTQCIQSGYTEYQRLYFWWNNGGDTRPKFRRIIEVFEENLITIEDIASEIVNDTIAQIENIRNYPYFVEVNDNLIYYSVRATCSMLLNVTGIFLKKLYDLQDEQLCKDDESYSMSKPGWVSLFRTMYQTFNRIDSIQNLFIAFDDENEKIVNTFTQTRLLIKNIYRHFYVKLITQWTWELSRVYRQHGNVPVLNVFLPLHLAAGMSFLYNFLDDFRRVAQYFRKRFWALLLMPNHFQPHQLAFGSMQNAARAFIADSNAIMRGQPFVEPMWQNAMPALFGLLNTYNAADVRIDLNESDLFI